MYYHPFLVGDFSTRELLNERITWSQNKPMTAHVIRHILPCAKFVVLMRDPVERLYSDYIYFMKKTPELISAEHFHKKVTESVEWWHSCKRRNSNPRCLFGSPKDMPPVFTGSNAECWQSEIVCPYIRIGLYYFIISEWLTVFPRESFLFLRTEDYENNEVRTLNEQVLPFLGLAPLSNRTSRFVATLHRKFPSKHGDVRSSLNAPAMLEKTRTLLKRFYAESNSRLAYLLSDDRFTWR